MSKNVLPDLFPRDQAGGVVEIPVNSRVNPTLPGFCGGLGKAAESAGMGGGVFAFRGEGHLVGAEEAGQDGGGR